MKNADMPAMPVYDRDNEPADFGLPFFRNGDVATGLTKREVMAMHAPEVPDWFISRWRQENSENGDYFAGVVVTLVFSRPVKSIEITDSGRAAMYFSWRTYYADSLLAELERSNGQ